MTLENLDLINLLPIIPIFLLLLWASIASRNKGKKVIRIISIILGAISLLVGIFAPLSMIPSVAYVLLPFILLAVIADAPKSRKLLAGVAIVMGLFSFGAYTLKTQYSEQYEEAHHSDCCGGGSSIVGPAVCEKCEREFDKSPLAIITPILSIMFIIVPSALYIAFVTKLFRNPIKK